MVDTDDIIIGGSQNETFVQHVFKFDEPSKKEMMNIVQYTVTALVPIVILNKLMQKYVPEADDEKGSMELLAEVVVQLVFMFVGILLINRIVTFIPTYSGIKYEQFSIIHMIPATLMILLSLQTKLGEKVSIIYDRVEEMVMGRREGNENMSTSPENITSQQQYYTEQTNPLVNAHSPNMGVNPQGNSGMNMSQSTKTTGTTGINSLRSDPVTNSQTGGPNKFPSEGFTEPMAANSLLGGSGFGSIW